MYPRFWLLTFLAPLALAIPFPQSDPSTSMQSPYNNVTSSAGTDSIPAGSSLITDDTTTDDGTPDGFEPDDDDSSSSEKKGVHISTGGTRTSRVSHVTPVDTAADSKKSKRSSL
ncbi:hypothetical protein MMC28_004096 [Mycoblastus sanguinarius]|nr:hypothetical protein [Mycoblastus sanguinarius]